MSRLVVLNKISKPNDMQAVFHDESSSLWQGTYILTCLNTALGCHSVKGRGKGIQRPPKPPRGRFRLFIFLLGVSGILTSLEGKKHSHFLPLAQRAASDVRRTRGLAQGSTRTLEARTEMEKTDLFPPKQRRPQITTLPGLIHLPLER